VTATTVSQAVEKRQDGPVAVMFGRKRHFEAVLPQSVDVEAFLGTAAGALYANPQLMAAAVANPDSLITVLMKCAALGHLPGTDEFYLYNRKRKGRQEVAGTEGYRGIIERMYRSGAVAKVVVREVCANDKFRYVEGVDDKPVHEIGNGGSTGADFFAKRDRGEMVGVYAYAELTIGAVSRVVLLTADDVMAAREASDAKDSDYSPWNRLDGGQGHPEFKGRSMWWKTGARRLEPWVPTSREYRASMLNASAKAAELAAPRRTELPPADGIVDAVIVDDTSDVPPAESSTPAAAPLAAPAAEPAGGTSTPDAPVTAVQVTRIIGHCKRLGWGESAEDREGIVSTVNRLLRLKVPVPLDKLTSGQADEAAAELARFGEGDAQGLMDYLNDGVVPDGQ
jgi:recombination protein RecT